MHVGRRSAVAALAATLLAAGPLAAVARAQIIPIKTLPLADGDQFAFFPSQNLGMGGVSIALADTTLDPFTNPATASRFRQRYFFGAPTFFSVSNSAGSGQTLPLGAIFTSGNTFGGVALAVQQIAPGRRQQSFGPIFLADAASSFRPVNDIAPGPFLEPSEPEPQGNRYAFAMLGRRLPDRGLSVAASAFASGLHAMDGVDVLYAGSQRVRQRGHTVDLRVGALKRFASSATLETVLAHNRYSMRHDPVYFDNFWDPVQRTILARERIEHNRDRTNTWGAHVVYERPIAAGWRAGGLFTANAITHPKITGYELMSIPRDPGRSAAYNLGLGAARSAGSMSYGVDVIYEPIVSHTWSEDTDNRFRFSNGIVRAGVAEDISLLGGEASMRLQLGVQGRGVSYRMHQRDLARATTREHEEQWAEWTRAWGASLRFPGVQLHYRGRMTSGAGRPGAAGQTFFPPDILASSSFSGSSIIAVSQSGTRLDAVNVVTHQLSLSLPIR